MALTCRQIGLVVSSVGRAKSLPHLAATARRPDITLLRLMSIGLFNDSRASKFVRQPVWNALYSSTCRRFLPEGLVTFLNLGYISDPGELDDDDTLSIADRVSERLYDQVVGNVDLRGQTVIEVGCGPGAGSAHLARAHAPRSLLGIDLNKDLIAWCREHHDIGNLQFQHGDAQKLPMMSDSIDVAINIESSHCYPSRPRFFEEIMRVLRPGGLFLFADLISSSGKKEASEDVVSAQLSDTGLVVESCVDITDNVLAARDAVSRSRLFRSRILESTPSMMVPVVEESLCLTGTQFYERIASRRLRYLQWRVSKPGESPATSSVVATAFG